MSGIAARLRNKIDVYSKTEIKNELGEKDYIYVKRDRPIFCEIVPARGYIRTAPDNQRYSELSHKITIRSKAVPDLVDSMYFMYQDKLRFNIDYFMPNYKTNETVEIFCSLVTQNDADTLGV